MAKEITMPKLSDTMTEGIFAAWRKNVGDRIERGDIIAEVETDKAVMELEAFASGILLKAVAKNGELVPVGTVLGLIGEPGELLETDVTVPVNEPSAAPPAATATTPSPSGAETASQPVHAHSELEHEKASPLVRRLARDQGIDLGKIHGSGPEGRITQDDLAAFSAYQDMPQIVNTITPVTSAADIPQQRHAETTAPGPASPMRQAIATAVTHSWQTIPHFSVSIEIDMGACREIVNELKAGTHPIGYNTLLIKACANCLERFPLLRSPDDTSRKEMNISFAVALQDGLLMPVIRGCEERTVAEIEQEAARLAAKCHEGRLSSEEMSGGCFSVSNLGMYGVDEFTALIMPGQTAILAAGAVSDRAVVRSGAAVAAATMRVTLCSDHRIVDGAYAARFLAELRSIMEKPVSLLV